MLLDWKGSSDRAAKRALPVKGRAPKSSPLALAYFSIGTRMALPHSVHEPS